MFKCNECGGKIVAVRTDYHELIGENMEKGEHLDTEEYYRCWECGNKSDYLEELVDNLSGEDEE